MQLMLDGRLLEEKVERHVGHLQQVSCMYTVGTSDAQAVWSICNVSFGVLARRIESAFTFVWMKLQS